MSHYIVYTALQLSKMKKTKPGQIIKLFFLNMVAGPWWSTSSDQLKQPACTKKIEKKKSYL